MTAKSASSTATKRVGIWIRVSTDEQAQGDSPTIHKERASDYAKFNGWTAVEVYDLAGVSGKSVKDHPECKRMLADVKRGHISGLIFSKLARLARNTKELLEFSDYFRAHSADMISLHEKIDTSTPAGRLFYTMIAAMAQWEREEIVERITASIKVRAKLGKSLGGAAPFGYKWEDGKLLPHPTEAPIRKLIYEIFATQKRRKSVARSLNNAGYRTRKGARFTDTTVMRLIQDPTAKGLYRANHSYRDASNRPQVKPEEEWVHTPVPAIVSEELWNQCNDSLNRRLEKRRLGPKPVHLFAGLLVCGCGQKMYVFSHTQKYICAKCRTKIPLDDLEQVFRAELQDFCISQDKVREHFGHANEHLEDKRHRLASHEKQLERVKGEMRKVYQLYTSDQIAADGFGKLYRPLEEQERSLATELPKLQAELDVLEVQQLSAEEIASEAMNLHRLWPQLDAERKRQIIESIVEKIVLTNDEINITFSYLPSSEELTKQQRNLTYPEIYFGNHSIVSSASCSQPHFNYRSGCNLSSAWEGNFQVVTFIVGRSSVTP